MSEETQINAADAKAVILKDRETRMAGFEQAIIEAKQKFRCDLVPQVVITGQRFETRNIIQVED